MTERLGAPLDKPIFGELAIIGVGLIGSSLARAARKQQAQRRASSSPTPRRSAARAEALSLGDRCTTDLADAVRDADLRHPVRAGRRQRGASAGRSRRP